MSGRQLQASIIDFDSAYLWTENEKVHFSIKICYFFKILSLLCIFYKECSFGQLGAEVKKVSFFQNSLNFSRFSVFGVYFVKVVKTLSFISLLLKLRQYSHIFSENFHRVNQKNYKIFSRKL